MAGYGTDELFAAWLAENGYVVPDGAPAPAVLRNRGAGYIDGVYGSRFSGIPNAGSEQERAWPRTGAYAFGSALTTTLIPNAVINASYRAAWLEASSPGWTSSSVDPSKRVKRQKVGDIEREFFEDGSAEVGAGGFAKVDADIDGMLAPFLSQAVSLPAILVV